MAKITLTDQQERALNVVVNRFLSGERLTVVAGTAGTGKSSLTPFIKQALVATGRVGKSEFVFTSFTGKATQVLQKKGLSPVLTMHKLLYKHLPNGRGGFVKIPLPEIPYKVVFVDEVSMVPKDLMARLTSHKNVYVVCFGDHHQIPPVDKNQDNGLLSAPHAELTEVHRQALESGVLRLATDIRLGKPLRLMQDTEAMVISKANFDPSMLKWADQVLCAKNETRQVLNKTIRTMRGFRAQTPEDGDKVICLRNYWDILSTEGEPLVNGTLGIVKGSFKMPLSVPFKVTRKSVQILNTNFETDSDQTFLGLNTDLKQFTHGQSTLDWKEENRMRKMGMQESLPLMFDYGYAITCWKAQGSEWDKVLVFEENFPFDKEEKRKVLYTAITRAQSKVVVVRM